MTWNIHGALGRNPRFDLRRVVAFIKNQDPDIVALQEVDSRRPPRGDDAFTLLQRAIGEHGIGAKSIVTEDGDYGQMLISRWPMLHTQVHDISYPEREPRRAIAGDIMTPQGPLRVVATHLGLSLRERRSQAKALLDLVGSPPQPAVVMGDFNDWLWAGSVRNLLREACPARTRFRTFPSSFPLLRLDRIYCRPVGTLMRAFTDRAARHISDHLPVVADVTVSPTREPDRSFSINSVSNGR